MLASGDDEGEHDVLAVDSGWLHQLVACLMVVKGVAVMAATLVYGSDRENVRLLSSNHVHDAAQYLRAEIENLAQGRARVDQSCGLCRDHRCWYPRLPSVKKTFTLSAMIESFIHKGLEELFEKGHSAKVHKALAQRALRRLDAIDTAKTLQALNIPGFDFHGLQGKPKRYSVHVNGPWCITFEWQGESALKLDLENYH